MSLINNKNLLKYHLLFMQIIYAECLIEKIDGCKIHSQKKVGEHVPSDFSVPITS